MTGRGTDCCRVGDGVLRMLAFWTSLRFRKKMHPKMMAPRRSAAPTKDPMTMPAIAPPDKLELEFPDTAPAPAVELVGSALEVVVVKRGGIGVVVGSRTP